MITALDHIAIAVPDFDKAIKRFMEDFGLNFEARYIDRAADDSSEFKEESFCRAVTGSLVKYLSGHAHALHGLRNTTIDADDVDDRAQLLVRHTVGDRAPKVGFPFGHLAERPDHREVHHGAGLGIDDVIAPAKAPAPRRHCLLEGPCEIIGGGEIFLDIFCAEGTFALLEAFEKEIFVEKAHV